MRIVSRDKTIDINYNNMTISLDPNETGVMAAVETSSSKAYLLGKYENKERAKEVMGIIRDAFKWYTAQESNGYYEMPEE